MSSFPLSERIQVGAKELTPGEAIELLEPRISAERRERIAQVVAQRTYSIVTVCDNLYDTGNMAAVMRSAEAMGIQEFHAISLQRKFKRSARITAGADKWLDFHTWRSRAGCIEHLKERGYRIVATQLSDDCVEIGEIDFTEVPTAIVFGNERDGVSEEVLEASDVRCILPMLGFAESYNISVAAALSFYHIRQDRIARQGFHNDLSEAERERLLADYYMRSVDRSEIVLEDLLLRRDG